MICETFYYCNVDFAVVILLINDINLKQCDHILLIIYCLKDTFLLVRLHSHILTTFLCVSNRVRLESLDALVSVDPLALR